jgi:hypothetical protein
MISAPGRAVVNERVMRGHSDSSGSGCTTRDLRQAARSSRPMSTMTAVGESTLVMHDCVSRQLANQDSAVGLRAKATGAHARCGTVTHGCADRPPPSPAG